MAGVESLTAQTESVERLFRALGLDGADGMGPDSSDSPGAVFE